MLKLVNITKSYRSRNIFDNMSFEVNEGEMVSIVGRSGSGKTTLLNILGLIDSPDNGEYILDGKSVNFRNDNELSRIRRKDIGFVVQNYALINRRKINFNIALPLILEKQNKDAQNKDAIKEKVINTSKSLGIEEHLNKYPHQLSGGECQRASIARALIKEPRVILADEPTGALDEKTEKEIINIFMKLRKRGITIIIATHNSEISSACDRVVRI